MDKLELLHQCALTADARKKIEHERREICKKVELKKAEEDRRYQKELTAEMRRLVEVKLDPNKPWSEKEVNSIISEAERSKFKLIYSLKTVLKSSMKDGILKKAKKSRKKSDRFQRHERRAPR